MAKRRTKSQIQSDQIIKNNLEKLGAEIYKVTKRRTRVLTGALKKSINYGVKPDTVLTFYQNDYGADVRPTGETSGPTDALLITIEELLPKGIEVVKKELTESIMYPFLK